MRNGYGWAAKIIGGLACVAMGAGLAQQAAAQDADLQSGALPAQTHVVERSKADPAPTLTPANLQVKEAGKPAHVTAWAPALSSGRGIELAFVIDNGLRTSLGNQLNDIRDFFHALPPGVAVMVGYMEFGKVVPATKGFTADREEAIAALRIPMGVPGGSASPYFCLSDLAKKWPSNNPNKARVVFMVTNGVDNYSGANPLDTTSPYVAAAIKDSQQAGLLVYSIYYSDVGIRGGGAQLSGQNYLLMTADATGAQTYWEGTGNPVSFKPFLEQFNGELGRIYEMQFMAHGSGLQPLKVTTDVKGVKLGAPDNVFVGAPE